MSRTLATTNRATIIRHLGTHSRDALFAQAATYNIHTTPLMLRSALIPQIADAIIRERAATPAPSVISILQDLQSQTVAQLRIVATELNIAVPSRILKADLVNKIAEARVEQYTQPVAQARQAMSLIGKLAGALRPHGKEKMSGFLLRAYGRPNLYISMSTLTHQRMLSRVQEGRLSLHKPVQVIGYFFAAKGVDRHGNPLPDGFHITGLRPARNVDINDPDMHEVVVEG